MSILIKLFFGANSIEEMKRKGIVTGCSFTAFLGVEWGITLFTGLLVGFMTGYLQWSELPIFLILWGGNLFVSLAIFFVNKNTEGDFTLMEGARRLVDASIEWSGVAGIILEIILLIPIILWEGAGAFMIFFQSRLHSKYAKVIAFIGVSGIQMAVWTKAFIFGYGLLEILEAIIF